MHVKVQENESKNGIKWCILYISECRIIESQYDEYTDCPNLPTKIPLLLSLMHAMDYPTIH